MIKSLFSVLSFVLFLKNLSFPRMRESLCFLAQNYVQRRGLTFFYLSSQRFLFILCCLFLFSLSACKADHKGDIPDDPWGPNPERELDPDTQTHPPIKIWTFEQVKSMTPQEIGDLGIPENIGDPKPAPFFQNLEHWHLGELSPEQLEKLFLKVTFFHERFPEEIYADFPEIKPEQLQKLTPEHIKKALCKIIKYLNPEQTKVLDQKQLIALEYCMEFLIPEHHLAVLDIEQIKAILPYLNRPQLAVIPPEYFRNDLYASHRVITPEQVASLTKEQIENSGFPLLLLYNKNMHWLSCEQISWIPNVRGMDPVHLANMTEEQLKCIPLEKTFKNLTSAQLRELSFSQLQIFKGNYEVNRILRFDKKHGADFFKNLSNLEDISQTYEYDIQFLRPEYFQAVTLEQAQHFSNILLSVLSPERIKNFRYYVRVLKPMRIWDFSDELVDVLPLDCQKNWCDVIALTKRQIEAITLEQMQDFGLDILMELGYKQVQAFSFEQISQLNKEQLKALMSIKSDGENSPNIVKYTKIRSVIDLVKWSGGERAKTWVESMLKPVMKELFPGGALCRDNDNDPFYDCESFEYEIKRRAKVRKTCQEVKERLDSKLPAYLNQEESYQYDLKSCIKNYYIGIEY